MEKTSTLERSPVVGAGPLGAELVALSGELRRYQYRIVVAAAAFAESPEWILDGSPTAAHWLATVADVEACTAREWIRIGKALTTLPVTAAAFAERRLSYSTVRTLTRTATPENEAELVTGVPASEVGKVIAAWMQRNLPPEDIAARQRASRSVKWRTEADGMVVFTMRLQPHIAAILISLLSVLVMRSKARREADGAYPSTAAQYADAVAEILDEGTGKVDTEVIFHVRGDGATCDDGTPICDTVIAQLVPEAFLRVLIHDADAKPTEEARGRRARSADVAGADGHGRLCIAHSESPFITDMVATAEDPTRFRQSAPFGPYDMEVVIELPEPGRITYAWWWAEAGGTPVEQSKADVRL